MTCHFDSLDTLSADTVFPLAPLLHRPSRASAHGFGGFMHELTLCQRTVEIIEQQAQRLGARRVTGVWLEIGAFSCVEQSALAFCFELVCRDTCAQGCTLHLAQQAAECWCHDCEQHVHLLTQRVRRCPQCNGVNLRIVADDGVQIKRLEIEQE